MLITLGIIGVVAALTLPNLIASYKKQEAGARLKKFNSIMAQALILSVNDNGDVNEWDMSLSPEIFAQKYFGPYLKTLSIEKNGSKAIIYFPDGTTVSMGKARCMDCHFDINGNKRPNEIGRDQFIFLACDKTISEWCSNQGWCTYRGNNQPTRDKALEACKKTPHYCSSLLEIDNWEFKKDYPYRL